MERIFRFYFLAFYFGIKRDKTFSRVGRAKFFVEFELYQIFDGLVFVLCGFIKYSKYSFLLLLILALFATLLASKTCDYYVRKNEGDFLKDIKRYTPKQRRVYAIIGYITFFVILLFMLYCIILGIAIQNHLYPK
jgi:hypothetical protein